MNTSSKFALGTALLLLATSSFAQSDNADDAESLKMAALEALIAAPAERALPIVDKVLAGNHSVDLKERALFILSQMETPDSQSRLLAYANDTDSELQTEAIRMIGIGGDKDALAKLGEIYRSGNADVREAVLEAYMIADEKTAIFEIAANTDDEDEFAEAVQMLGAMGANDELRELRGRAGLSTSIIEAIAISGDPESIDELVGIYQDAESEEIKESALEGLMIAGRDKDVLTLYRNATDSKEKRQLLEYLVMMDSDAVWDLIDNALEESE